MGLMASMVKALDRLSGGKIKSQFREAQDFDSMEDVGIDFRPLSGSKRDLSPWSFTRQREMAFYLWQRNPIFKRMIDSIVQFTTGDEMQVKIRVMKKQADDSWADSKRADAQAVWDEFATSLQNNFYENLPTLVSDHYVSGELVLPTEVRAVRSSGGEIAGDGFVRLGYLDPSTIKEVKVDPMNANKVVAIIFDSKKEANGLTLKPVDVDADPTSPTYLRLTGDVIYRRLNRSSGQVRGHSFLLEHLDWLDVLDQFLFDALRGFQARNTFFWSVLMKGLSDGQIEEKAKTFKVPATGRARIHNEEVEYEAKSPQLGSIEVDTALTSVETFIVGSKGFPMTWFGTGENANKASSSEMSVPTLRMLKAIQRDVKNLVRFIVLYVLDQGVIAKTLPLKDGQEKFDIDITLYDFERKDAAVLGTAFQAMVNALQIAKMNNWVSDDVAKATVDGTLRRLGVEVPSEETVEDIRKENEKQAEKSLLQDYNRVGNPPPDGSTEGKPGNGAPQNQPKEQPA